MTYPLIDIIAGARPNFMKIAPIIRALDARKAAGGRLRYRLVHTGQHYDRCLSGEFFEQLGLPPPHVDLEVGPGTQAEQTGAVMTRYERLLSGAPSKLCLVVGDVTSTMACAITAQKMKVPVAHVEGGLRSGDWGMPEEINRMATDAVSTWFFTTSETASAILRSSGVAENRIFFVGNTMIDTLLVNLDRLRPPPFWTQLGLQSGGYIVLTLHRPSNVDDHARLYRLLAAIGEGARDHPIVFPVHPRTRKCLEHDEFRSPSLLVPAQAGPRRPYRLPSGLPLAGELAREVVGGSIQSHAAPGGVIALPKNLHPVEPQPYLEFNYLVRHAKAAITDSGGVTEETTVLGVPCMTLRSSTERPETVTIGTNEILGTDPRRLKEALDRLMANRWKQGGIPEKWDGRAGERIVATLERLL